MLRTAAVDLSPQPEEDCALTGRDGKEDNKVKLKREETEIKDLNIVNASR
jgi:hypothetical protein